MPDHLRVPSSTSSSKDGTCPDLREFLWRHFKEIRCRGRVGLDVVWKGRASYVNVYWSAGTEALVPPAVVTLMLCSLAAAAGDTAVISVEDTTSKLVAAPAPR